MAVCRKYDLAQSAGLVTGHPLLVSTKAGNEVGWGGGGVLRPLPEASRVGQRAGACSLVTAHEGEGSSLLLSLTPTPAEGPGSP